MHPLIERAAPEIEALCRRLGVCRLDVFGSATGTSFDPGRSDVDVLVELGPRRDGERFDTFFALKEGLERILGRPVDMVSTEELENPYFARRVAEGRQQLYAA